MTLDQRLAELDISEAEVRAMRDRVYGKLSTDTNWAGCSEHWMKPEEVKWLREQCGKIDGKMKI